MAGIMSIGLHIPLYRLHRDVIAKAWDRKSLGGERTVAGADEDSLTMAVNAAFDCIDRDRSNGRTEGLFFSSTTFPYREKQASATIATALDLPTETYTADIGSSRRGVTVAMNLAIAMVESKSAENVIVAASDSRLGTPQSDLEQRFGDAGAAIMIGNGSPIAKILAKKTMYDEFFDQWRMERDVFVRSWEERFAAANGFIRVVKKAVVELLEKNSLSPKDFASVILCGGDPRMQTELAKMLGFDVANQLQQCMFSSIGQTGTAEPLLMLAAALGKAGAGDKILFVNYADGSDSFILEATGNKSDFGLRKQLEKTVEINYERYLSWRDIVPVEFPRRPDPELPSVARRWRERRRILTLSGVTCRHCGTVQYPPQRVCVNCGSKDNFEEAKLSRKKASVFSFATDRLTSTKAPPMTNVFIEFEGGGRMLCEMTDCDPSEVKIGMSVEMTFRKISQLPDMYDYFWKARPAKV